MSAQREIREYSYEADVTDSNGDVDQFCSMCQVPIYPGHPEPDERLRAFWASYADAYCGHVAVTGKFPAKIEICLYNRSVFGTADIEPVVRGTLEEIRQDIELGF